MDKKSILNADLKNSPKGLLSKETFYNTKHGQSERPSNIISKKSSLKNLDVNSEKMKTQPS